MKMKRKGKIHPSPPPQPAEAHVAAAGNDSLSVLNLLPAAILALAAVLSLQDREVLAYMITRSLKTPTTSSINAASSVHESKKLYHRNSNNNNNKQVLLHKPPAFDCECFDCYTSFWYRWDSSPNRELIHQAIEAFEEHLASGGEVMWKGSGGSNRRGKKKKFLEKETQIPYPVVGIETGGLKVPTGEMLPEVVDTVDEAEKVVEVNLTPVVAEAEKEEKEKAVVVATGHKGFVRKVLPDVLGVFNSRLWNLWGPNC